MSFEEYLASLAPFAPGAAATDPDVLLLCERATRLKTWLKSRFATAGWVHLGRSRAQELIEALDEEVGLLALLEAQGDRSWTWADVRGTAAAGE